MATFEPEDIKLDSPRRNLSPSEEGEIQCRRHFERLLDAPFPRACPTFFEYSPGLELSGYNEERKLAFEYYPKQYYEYDSRIHHSKAEWELYQSQHSEKQVKCAAHQVKLIIVPYYVRIGQHIRQWLEGDGFIEYKGRTHTDDNVDICPKYKPQSAQLGPVRIPQIFDISELLEAPSTDEELSHDMEELVINDICIPNLPPPKGNSPPETPELRELREIAADNGLTLVTKHINPSYPPLWRCGKHHYFSAYSVDVEANARRCDVCQRQRPRPIRGFESAGERRCREVMEDLHDGALFPRARPEFLLNPSTGRCLELDGYNRELGIAFEYQGQQHYQYVPLYHRTEAGFIEEQGRDAVKAAICARYGIDLITIPYNVDPEPYLRAKLGDI